MPRQQKDSTEDSMERPISKILLEKHGYTVKEEYEPGVSGKVFLVTDAEGDYYMIKEIHCRNKNKEEEVKEDVEILKTLNHGYVASYVDSFEDKEAGFLYFVMEFCAGNLYKRMKAQKEEGFFEEEQILDWLVQICLALQYMHENNVLHRYINLQNVFLTEEGYINIGDFGLLERADAVAQSGVGADLYVSPEVYEKKYNSKSNIWSLGWLLHDLCMLEMWSCQVYRDVPRWHERLRWMTCSCSPRALPFYKAREGKANTKQRSLKHAQISERYSEELRELIKQMLSCDPKDRPSVEEILTKPFLREAVIKNKGIPEVLQKRLMESINVFNEAYNEHFTNFEKLVKKWGETTDSLEQMHYNTTLGSLGGAVIGAAGGVTTLVGLALAPVTLGGSLIVTGVGVGVGVAGGATGAASNITNTVKQKTLGESFEKLKQDYEKISTPILNSMNTLRKEIRKITKFQDFVHSSTFNNAQMSWRTGRATLAGATEFITLGMLAGVGKIAVQSAKVGRVVAAASGVLSAALVIADVAFIVKDSKELHEMRQNWRTDDPEKVSSDVLKSIAQMRKTHKELCSVLEDMREMRLKLNPMKK